MERFIVFGFDQYYPCGGLGDIATHTKTMAEAVTYCKANEGAQFECCQILDCVEGQEVRWRSI